MSKKFSPSPAFALAVVALLVALGGSAIAGVPAKVARAINGSSIKRHSIPGSKLKPNTLTGAQIAERKLGVVPRAKHANSATTAGTAINAGGVGGMAVRRVSFVTHPGTSNQGIGSLPGINLIASCGSTGNASLVAQSTANGGDVRVSLVQHTDAGTKGSVLLGADTGFDTSQTIDMTRGADSGNGTLEYVNKISGQIGQVTYTFHNGTKTALCVFGGVAIGG